MQEWLMLLLPSAVFGFTCGVLIQKKYGTLIAGFGPVFGLFTALIYTVYLRPNADGGDGLWIIALLFGGTIAAATSVFAFTKTQKILRRSE